MSVRALIFDLDGVIADTVLAHEQGWSLVADRFGLHVSRDQLDSFRGKRRHDILRSLAEGVLSEDEIESAMAVKVAHYDGFLAQLSPAHILPGVEALMQAARARGLALAVASSSFNARTVLTKLGLIDRFDVVADGPTVVRPKPHPDIFVWTAGALRVRPSETIVFEDAAAGVAAARDAGALVVGVGSPLHVGAADLIVPDLVDFDLESLL